MTTIVKLSIFIFAVAISQPFLLADSFVLDNSIVNYGMPHYSIMNRNALGKELILIKRNLISFFIFCSIISIVFWSFTFSSVPFTKHWFTQYNTWKNWSFDTLGGRRAWFWRELKESGLQTLLGMCHFVSCQNSRIWQSRWLLRSWIQVNTQNKTKNS